MYRLTDSEPFIRLPEVTPAEIADTYLELGRIAEGLPYFRVIMSAAEAKRHSAELARASGVMTQSRLETAVSILRRTAALAPEELRPPVLCAIAWMLWARGRGVLALAHLAEALRIEPGHVLACGLMLHFSSTVPKWIRSRRAPY